MNSQISALNEQDIVLQGRKQLSLSGVSDVIAFNDEILELSTALGNLSVRGNNIKITVFNNDSGQLEAVGEFYAFVYSDNTQKESFFKRIFK